MGIANRIKKMFKNDTPTPTVTVDDILLQALLNGETITKEKALTLPVVSSAVDYISGTIASMPIKLYKYKKGKVEEVENDPRTKMLNGDTGDTLDAFQMKKAMVVDYLLAGNGYAYIRKNRNNVVGLYYVKDEDVTVYKNEDPIYKFVQFGIGTKMYKNYEVIKLLRNTKDGARGKGLVDEISKPIETAFSTLLYQLGLVKTGGNKKGFLQSERKLGQEEIDKLKQAWRNLYANATESVVVLNNGLKFQESSNSSVEMQLNESKKTLSDEINEVFHISKDQNKTFKEAIYPILKAFQTAINATLLLESEKKNYYFDFDVKEILRASPKEMAEAHKIEITSGYKTINEVRREDNLNYIEGMDVLNLGLGAVLYDTTNNTYYTPNTGEFKQANEQSNEEEDDNSQNEEKGGNANEL